MTIEHSALLGKDTRNHRIIHEFLNAAHVAMTEENGLATSNPDDVEIIDYAFNNTAHYLRHTYADNVAAMEEPEKTMASDPSVFEQFVFRTAFEMGLRLGKAGRALFEAKTIESFTDEKWQEEVKEEAEWSAKQDAELREWEGKLQKFLKMDDEQFADFKDNDRPIVMPFSHPHKVREFYELLSQKPGGHVHTHDHGPSSSPRADTRPGEGTGQYL